MPVTVVADDDELFDPDDLNPDEMKLPESPHHRRAVDAIGLAATSLLGADFDVFRDMNWYPPDGGNAIAPDVMVLPVGAFVAAPDAKPDAPEGKLAVVLPGQIVATSDHEILAATKNQLAAAEQRAAELARRLREAGIDPDG